MRRGFSAVILLILLARTAAFGSENHTDREKIEYRFEHLWLEEGLSQSSVRTLFQDSRGFLWIGTEDGLNKYDGYEFKAYKSNPDDPNSLGSNFIRAIHESPPGVLWIGTNGGGITRFDTSTDIFTRYQAQDGGEGAISNNYVWDIHEDESGILWVGTDGGGLNRFDRATGRFEQFRHDPENVNSLSGDAVISLSGDGRGSIWIGTREHGLNRFDPATGSFVRYVNDPDDPESIGEGPVWSILPWKNGSLWVGTCGGGLNYYDPERDCFTRFRHDPADPGSVSSDRIYGISEDMEGNLWIGTDGAGLNRFDPESRIFNSYIHNPNDPNSISYNHIYCALEDRSGILWVGTEIRGLDKIDKNRRNFKHYHHVPDDPATINHQSVWSVYLDTEGTLWIGTRAGGLNRYDRENNAITYFINDPDDPNSIAHNHIRAIYEAPSEPGALWIGTDGGGLNRLDKSTGVITRFVNDPGNPSSISCNRIYSIMEDRRGGLWVGTRTGGLNLFDRESGTFVSYRNDPEDPSSICDDFIYKLYEDHFGDIWIGTFSGGLCRFDGETAEFVNYRNVIGDSSSLSSDCVLSIFEDRAGRLWLGTAGGGLNLFIRDKDAFRRYSKDDGLANDFIYGILSDGAGNLWMSTNYGICRFNPETGAVRNYSVQDGLQSNEFNGGAYCKGYNGEMFFGGVNGVNAFFPDKIKENLFSPPVVITDFKIFNRSVPIGTSEEGEDILSRSINETNEIKLSHDQNFITIEFAALDFTVPEKNRYMHMMEGFDDEWVYTTGRRRFSTYKNLPPGRYTFKVKGSNGDGVWNDEVLSLAVTITPPFWGTWWFRLLIFAAFVFSGISYYRGRLKNIWRKAELEAAHDAQMAIMPHGEPSTGRFDISGICLPAYEVGGDFYDYIWLDGERRNLGVVIGDVSGKAMRAAMVAVMSNGMALSRADGCSRPARFMTKLNHSMCLKTEEEMFTALCFLSLNTEDGTVVFSNAGMNFPLLKSNSNVDSLGVEGPCLPLGAFEGTVYRDRTIRLNPGDVLVLFTDGVTEARDKNGGFYELESLRGLLSGLDSSALTAEEIQEAIIGSVEGFSGHSPQDDDMTVIVIKANG